MLADWFQKLFNNVKAEEAAADHSASLAGVKKKLGSTSDTALSTTGGSVNGRSSFSGQSAPSMVGTAQASPDCASSRSDGGDLREAESTSAVADTEPAVPASLAGDATTSAETARKLSMSKSAPNLRSPRFLGIFSRGGPSGAAAASSTAGVAGGSAAGGLAGASAAAGAAAAGANTLTSPVTAEDSPVEPRSAALSENSDNDGDGEEVSLFGSDGDADALGTNGNGESNGAAKPSLDDFSTVSVLGKGSYGKVVLVRKKNTGVLYGMKVLKKGDVVRKRQVERTKIERRVLGHVDHPFLMRLHYAFQTDSKLYLVLDYCPGGELFFHLSRYKRFPEGVVRFYSAELVLALKHLHDAGIIYRDIKPENILLDAEGHIKLGDFGLAKDNITDATFGAQSVCGTPEYMAPEVINKSGHGTAVDWWGLGMLMYEMLTGLPPWYTKDRQKLFERLRGAPLVIPKALTPQATAIIQGLLTRNPAKRLGALGAKQVMTHPFFGALDWEALLAKRIPAPLNPCRNQGANSAATTNFDPQFTRMPIDTIADAGSGAHLSPLGEEPKFEGFTFDDPGAIREPRP